ncbi:MAG TPA: (Fe-S)-binding protein [Anaerolineae bacterium]|nr:(Fe-S)-binding protein [Anaerolineae bacterium]
MFNDYTREEAIAERQTLMDGKWAPILRHCASCHACNERCPEGANPWDLIGRLQGIYREVDTGEYWAERGRAVDEERMELLAAPLPERADTVMLTCIVGAGTPEVFDSLLYTGVPRLVGPAYYCNNGLEYFGDEDGQRARARGFVDVIARFQPHEVVCYHDQCYFLLTYRMPEYGIDVPFRPVHLFEFLVRTVRQHRGMVRPLNLKVAYQRPCSSRNTQDKEHFLDELLGLLGCKRVAREYDRENALCCGAMYGARGLSDKAVTAALTNIEDSLEHGAEVLLCLCPSCLNNYAELAPERGLPVYHVSELCRIALGEEVG